LATTNPNSGTILIEFDTEGFTVTPMSEDASATPYTVSAHMLYENSNPYQLYEPGGHLDVTEAKYVAISNRSVRVTGSQWIPSERYTVKLEGARRAGFQTVSIALVREPSYVANIRKWVADIESRCKEKARARVGEDFALEMRLIGLDATLGSLDATASSGSEVGVMGIVTAPTEAVSREVAKILNPYLLHHPLTEQEEMPTFAFPFSPTEMPRGEIYEFCLNHVLELDNPMNAFRLETLEIGA
jgi:hypothetical protein